MTPTIRRATAADAGALTRIGRSTFIDTFGHLYAAEDLQAFLDESHAPEAYARLAADDRYALWLLEDGGRTVVPGAHRLGQRAVALALARLLEPGGSNNPEGSLDRRGHGRRVPRPVAHQAYN